MFLFVFLLHRKAFDVIVSDAFLFKQWLIGSRFAAQKDTVKKGGDYVHKQ